MEKLLKRHHGNIIPSLLVAYLFFSFHAFLILYINSPFLEQHIPPSMVGLLFSAGALINIVLLSIAPILIKRFGAYTLLMLFIFIEFLAILLISLVELTPPIITLFVVYRGSVIFVAYLFDLFLEDSLTSEKSTGKIRGILLTLSNTALILSPAIAGLLLSKSGFGRVYVLSSLFLIPVLLLVSRNFKQQSKSIEVHSNIFKALKKFRKNDNLRNILAARTLLNFFYAWMVVYMPIYLLSLNWTWSKIGIVFTIMLLPFALFELPAGYIADKKTGEKEILIAGFIIMGISTFFLSQIAGASIFIIALLLFITRTGASLVEIMCESYFFKHVDGDDSSLISIYRMTNPMSYLIGPLVGSIVLFFFSFEVMFGILGIIMFWGIYHALHIKDTK